MTRLTPRRNQVLQFYAARIESTGEAPTQTEAAKEFGLSVVTVHHILGALEDMQYIERDTYRWRGVRVLRLPAA